MPEFTLQAITDGDSLQLGEVFASIAAAEGGDPAALRKEFAGEWLFRFAQANPWDERLQALYDEFTPIALAHIANSDEFYCNEQDPLLSLIHI